MTIEEMLIATNEGDTLAVNGATGQCSEMVQANVV